MLSPRKVKLILIKIINDGGIVLTDPQVKVAGPPEAVNEAREMILSELDTKTNRVTLKVNVANIEHSHVIGREGTNIKKGFIQTLLLMISHTHTQFIKILNVIYIFLTLTDMVMETRVIKCP